MHAAEPPRAEPGPAASPMRLARPPGKTTRSAGSGIPGGVGSRHGLVRGRASHPDPEGRVGRGKFDSNLLPLPLVQTRTMGWPEPAALETGEVCSVKDAGAPVLDLEEARLIRDAVAGDLRAFESLYRRHGGRAYAIALRLTGNPDRS